MYMYRQACKGRGKESVRTAGATDPPVPPLGVVRAWVIRPHAQPPAPNVQASRRPPRKPHQEGGVTAAVAYAIGGGRRRLLPPALSDVLSAACAASA
eukprot:scaffold18425_cov112-Isochrysis_galbana.AAC.4